MIKYATGIDISMKSFHVCLSSIDSLQQVKVKSSSTFANNVKGFNALHDWIQKHYTQKELPMVICLEATGVYYEQCAMYLFKAGYDVSVILPNKAKKYLQATGLKSKNDKIDAQGLARMAAEQCLELWKPMSDFYYTLRALTRQHQSLQELKTSLCNQLHAQEHSMLTIKQVISQLKQLIAKVDQQIEAMSNSITAHIQSNQDVAKKVSDICSIKGVGLHTAAVIVAETNGFALFENAPQLVSYSGYDVVENQSGNRKGKTKISKRGNGHIRRVLHLPAFNVVRYEVPQFFNLYTRTFDKHGIKMKSYVAVQKKLLVIIYTLWKRNEPYDLYKCQGKSIGDEELVTSSQLSFEKAERNNLNKNSADHKPALHKVVNRRRVAV